MKRLVAVVSAIAALVLPTAALAANPPLGKFTAKIKAPANLKGTWVLNFAKTGKYTISDNGTVVVRGRFSAAMNIYLSNESGPAACPQVGAYKWKRTGKTLKFTKVNDPCTGRATVLGKVFTATA